MRRLTWWLLGALTVCLVFVAGLLLGRESMQREGDLLAAVAPVKAKEMLDAGDIDRALSLLHFAKSKERNSGETDALLGDAYLKKGVPCLARDYYASGDAFMSNHGLKALPAYAALVENRQTADRLCEEQPR